MAKDREPLAKPGEVLDGKYRVERLLGSGGMGIVVAARHIQLNQRFAVKFLRQEALDDTELVERFMREARASVRLQSENAARVFDVGTLRNGAPYMVMELLKGRDLGKVVAEGPLPVHDAVEYILQASAALAEAHALGIVHRDVKPSNLFLTQRVDGQSLVKVLDFGLAKVGGKFGADRGLTATRAVMGSPQYMSPEQLRATRDVDMRTDIWSLGVTLYELLSGTFPFDADSMPVMCVQVLTQPPRPLTDLLPDLPDGLWAVLERTLQKDAKDRPGNVSELAAALEPFASSSYTGVGERISRVLLAAPSSFSDAPPNYPLASDIELGLTQPLLQPRTPTFDFPIQVPHMPPREATPASSPTPPPPSVRTGGRVYVLGGLLAAVATSAPPAPAVTAATTSTVVPHSAGEVRIGKERTGPA